MATLGLSNGSTESCRAVSAGGLAKCSILKLEMVSKVQDWLEVEALALTLIRRGL